MASSPPFKVGMIGYGLSAKVFHLPWVERDPDFKLKAVVQRNPTADNDAAKDYPGVTVYKSADEMFRDPQVDLVIVGTPPASHLELAKKALESGKHVVVEKPFTITSADADELIRTAKEHGRVLAVYQNRRWDLDYLTLKSILDSKILGRVVEFETHFDRYSPGTPRSWKANAVPGSGVVYDLGTHLMDQVVHSFGMPEKVTGVIHSQRAGDTGGLEDSCTILLHYDGMLATVKASVISPETRQLKYWVRGDKGRYKKFGEDLQEPQLKKGMKLDDPGFGREPETGYGYLDLVGADGSVTEQRYANVEPVTYAGFYAQLAKALKGEGPPPVSGEDGRNVIRLVELARESSRIGRTLEVS